MAKTANGSHAPSSVQLSYQLLRNITSPDETATGVKSFVVNLPALEILKLGTKENLRSYLAEYSPRKRNRVHDAIEYTIETEPLRFITRNSGFVIAASDMEVDDGKKLLRLKDASVLNGAQSQGEIRRWAEKTYGEDLTLFQDSSNDPPFHVRAEIVIDSDSAEVVETAIARNTTTPVKSISQAGARGHLDELEAAIQQRFPNLKIQKKETDIDHFDTRKILQFARLLMPISVSNNESAAETLRAYKNPEQCLTDFSTWYERRAVDPEAKRKYDFTVSIAGEAIGEYDYWEKNEAWNGQYIWDETKKGGRACRRNKAGKIMWVSPGLVFPILRAMSEFAVEEKPGCWTLKKPPLFKPTKMIAIAVEQFRGVESDPMMMGRHAGTYDALRLYPATIVGVMGDLKAAEA